MNGAAVAAAMRRQVTVVAAAAVAFEDAKAAVDAAAVRAPSYCDIMHRATAPNLCCLNYGVE